MMMKVPFLGLPFLLPLLAGCADTELPEETNAEEVITTVRLTFVPEGGGDPVLAWWRDAGLVAPTSGNSASDAVTLSVGTTYAMTVAFLNELEEPAEDLSVEVGAEAEEHQVFVTGSAVEGPATEPRAEAPLLHAYADVDPGGLPLGLLNTVVARSSGSGTLEVTLRHLPALGGVPSKVPGLEATLATDGMGALPGESDVDVDFAVMVL